ncbi:MAG: rhodanese-like domain-containing protein [Ilyomonas sp.]
MQHITASALKQKLEEGENIFLLDVREPFEHEEYNIGGTLIPLNDVIKGADIIPADKPVVVYCRKGVRSQIAIQRLQEKFPFNNLINLEGGIESWKKL